MITSKIITDNRLKIDDFKKPWFIKSQSWCGPWYEIILSNGEKEIKRNFFKKLPSSIVVNLSETEKIKIDLFR
jgi:hypothetical protein